MTTSRIPREIGTEDVIDVRDVIERIEYIEDSEDEDDRAELATLTALMDELQGMGGDEQWRGEWYPITLIADSYFEDYARETADDLYGNEMRDTHWPFNCIDWERATAELQQDYSSIEYQGVTYWTR